MEKKKPGRPKGSLNRGGRKAIYRISLSIESALLVRARAAAIRDRMSLTAFVEEALTWHLQSHYGVGLRADADKRDGCDGL